MWGCVLTPASGCFTPVCISETITSQRKADYMIVNTIFFVTYDYFLNASMLFYITRIRGYRFYKGKKRQAEMFSDIFV